MPSHEEQPADSYNETIALKGFRLTGQRRAVYDALITRRDHPTATDVFMRVKEALPSISLATVYNCLETLTECGLVRHVNIERQPSRYCPNTEEHAHFFCDGCGVILDVPKRLGGMGDERWEVPAGCEVRQVEVSFRGDCPECSLNTRAKDASSEPKRPANTVGHGGSTINLKEKKDL